MELPGTEMVVGQRNQRKQTRGRGREKAEGPSEADMGTVALIDEEAHWFPKCDSNEKSSEFSSIASVLLQFFPFFALYVVYILGRKKKCVKLVDLLLAVV